MDLKGEDACDKAKMNGIDKDFKNFQDCSLRKKIIPLMPNGSHPNFDQLLQKTKGLKRTENVRLLTRSNTDKQCCQEASCDEDS